MGMLVFGKSLADLIESVIEIAVFTLLQLKKKKNYFYSYCSVKVQ